MEKNNYIIFKRKCAKCHKGFIPDFCKCCKYKDFGLCWSCHKKTKHHMEMLRNV